MKRQILLDQMDDKVRKGLAVEIDLYSKLMNNEITEEECNGLVETAEGLSVIIKAVVDIYKGNTKEYEGLIYTLAQGEPK